MSARFQRRTFAAPFVVTTLAGCMVQSAPPSQPHQTTMSNPPRPHAEPGPEQTQPQPQQTGDTSETRWTVMKQGDKCLAYVKVECPAGTMCNPPRPSDYTCTPEITDTHPMKIVRWAGQDTCVVEGSGDSNNCPPRASCNPPPPQRVTCPR
jgi:hypothetical protein